MVRLRRAFSGILFLTLIIGLASANWRFYGTQFRLSEDKDDVQLAQLFSGREYNKVSSIRQYIQEHSSEPEKVLQNFKQTRILRQEVRDKAYYDDKLLEHACPVTIRASTKTPISRVPDVIGVGFAKCGTGALAFLDCHPRAVFRTTEPRFFDQKSKLEAFIAAENNPEALNKFRRQYAGRVPNAASDEILIEKSPQYAGGSEEIRKLRAKAMKIINPNSKLIAVVCDPIKRAFSQLSMKDRRTKDRSATGRDQNCRSCLKGSLPEAVSRFTATMRQSWIEGRESGYAAFSMYLRPFIDVFGEDKVLILDGENMIKDPNTEWKKIIKFIGLEEEHFSFNIPDDKGFPCLAEPIKFCLNSAKGTSRKVDVTGLYPEKTDVWKKAFSVSIKKTILALKICPRLDEACCKRLRDRFNWAKKYFCDDFDKAQSFATTRN